jgi:uncharacterized membrane protein
VYFKSFDILIAIPIISEIYNNLKKLTKCINIL